MSPTEEIADKRELADELRQHPEKLEAIVTLARGQWPECSGPEQEKGVWSMDSCGNGMAVVAAAWLLSRRVQHRD